MATVPQRPAAPAPAIDPIAELSLHRKLELDAKRREEAMQRALDKATERAERAELATDVLGKALASMPDLPGVDYDAEENAYPKTKRDAMKLVDKKNNDSSTPLSD